MLKQHGGRVAVQNARQTKDTQQQRTAQQRLSDLSFSRFMREHNAKVSGR